MPVPGQTRVGADKRDQRTRADGGKRRDRRARHGSLRSDLGATCGRAPRACARPRRRSVRSRAISAGTSGTRALAIAPSSSTASGAGQSAPTGRPVRARPASTAQPGLRPLVCPRNLDRRHGRDQPAPRRGAAASRSRWPERRPPPRSVTRSAPAPGSRVMSMRLVRPPVSHAKFGGVADEHATETGGARDGGQAPGLEVELGHRGGDAIKWFVHKSNGAARMSQWIDHLGPTW